MGLRDELIQVAAVAVAVVEDLAEGSAEGGARMDQVLDEVRHERRRQNEKWGAQHHDPADWLAILMEEVGEVGEDTLVFEGPHEGQQRVLRAHIEALGHVARKYLEARFGYEPQQS